MNTKNKKDNYINVVELFAGVGGFRLGLEGWEGNASSSDYKKVLNTIYRVVWGNQWEPSTKSQEAYKVYSSRFEGEHSNEDIQKVIESDFKKIPDHDLLVGGFPCQDYSVARTLKQAAGLKGKKGVLWWSIHAILEKKIKQKKPVKYLMLENVDRLLKSPASQRGRDFAIMLASLSDLGYAVEWRVINAADYGMPQRRRRVFFIGYHNSTKTFKEIKKLKHREEWILHEGVISKAFPIIDEVNNKTQVSYFDIEGRELADITDTFNKKGSKSPFHNSGLMIDRHVYTIDSKPKYSGKSTLLKDIIVKDESKIPKQYFINGDLSKWKELKGAKKLTRINKDGFEYEYAEGSMVFPDDINKSSRTIITGEGGSSPSRFKHVIQTSKPNTLRRLTPLELERLNMFPDGHTAVENISDVKRAFFMGNALVVGIVEKLGESLAKEITR